jgi:ribosome-binding factor A
MNDKNRRRIEETVHRLVAEILIKKVKDPRVKNVSITGVKLSRDYSVAKIKFNVIGGSENLGEVERGLKKCSGFLHSQLKPLLHIRIIPELLFSYDSSLDRAMRIERLIDKIHDEKGKSGKGR